MKKPKYTVLFKSGLKISVGGDVAEKIADMVVRGDTFVLIYSPRMVINLSSIEYMYENEAMYKHIL